MVFWNRHFVLAEHATPSPKYVGDKITVFNIYYCGSSMWILMYRSTTDHVFCIRQTLEKKWEYNKAVHRVLIDFKRAYDSGTVWYSHWVWYPHETGKVIKMCLIVTYNRLEVGRHLSDMFPIKNCVIQEDALSPFLFNFAMEYAIRKFR